MGNKLYLNLLHRWAGKSLGVVALLLLSSIAYAQRQPDSLKTNSAGNGNKFDTLRLDKIKIFPRSRLISKWVKQGIDAITKDPVDTAAHSTGNTPGEQVYKKHNGKVIRHITVKRLGFEHTINDTANKLISFGHRVLNHLHVDTREWVIRDNLFIKEGEALNAYKMADNERYLRTLNFIQDARIHVKPIRGDDDSVDVEVVTKDLFTISGGVDIGSINHAKVQGSESNFLGMGQRIQFTGLLHQERDPKFGYELLYSKNSVFGSLINATIGYTQVNGNSFDGKEEETAYFISMDRPLVSPFTRYAGGLYLGHKRSVNAYPINRPDSHFYSYANNVFDAWAGKNIADEELLNSNAVRDRRFLSARYAQSFFDKIPEQVRGYDARYNDMQLALMQLTFFKQDFYKTSYIYGFGTTEDIPYGYNLSLIGGWHRQLHLKRPYAGIKANRYFVSGAGDFFRYFVHSGFFYHSQELEDATIVIGGSMFSRLVSFKGYKARQFLSLSYGGVFNKVTSDLLRIDNTYGLIHSSYPNVVGNQRINLGTETYFFLNRKFLGFRFAPFVSANAVLVKPENISYYRSDIYTSVGGGIRTRNENLVFGTIELRGLYFPRKVEGQPMFKILLSSDLRFRYNSSYVNRPDFVNVNVDENIYR